MPSNEIQEMLADGGVPVGAAAVTSLPAVVEVLADVGYDFVFVDLEHGAGSPYDAPTLEHLTRAADAAGVELLVRVPAPEPSIVRKVLDTGVRNLLVPRVETAAEVRRAVEAGHFEYDGGPGDRGFSPSRTNRYGGAMGGYTEREDETVLVGAMIENETAVENVEEILSVPALGFVLVGPSDLSVSLGHPGDHAHPEVQDRIDDVLAAANETDVPVAGVVMGESPQSMVDSGFDILLAGSDVGAIRKATPPALE